MNGVCLCRCFSSIHGKYTFFKRWYIHCKVLPTVIAHQLFMTFRRHSSNAYQSHAHIHIRAHTDSWRFGWMRGKDSGCGSRLKQRQWHFLYCVNALLDTHVHECCCFNLNIDMNSDMTTIRHVVMLNMFCSYQVTVL